MQENENAIQSIAEAAKAAKEVLPQTTTQADEAISTLVGWFNNVVLYPIKKANITYRYKLECFEDDLSKKVSMIPIENQHEPNLMIAGPTLEALKYSCDEEDLREMYVNLLSSSMDSRKDGIVHPSYVQVIQQMNSFDAKLFYYLSKQNGYIKAINPEVRIKGTGKIFVDAMPDWYIDYSENIDVFQTSAAIVRLSKLGLIELMFDRTAGNEGYDNLSSAEPLHVILDRYQASFPDKELEISTMESVIFVNDYGKQFATTCLL